MSRWARTAPLDEPEAQVGDDTIVGLDMKTPDPANMQKGFLREAYNVRMEQGGLVTRKGCLAPGALNYAQYNQIYGVGIFSNPDGLEWLVLSVSNGVWFARDSEAPRFIPTPEVCPYPIEFVQAFDILFMFRGPDETALLWRGDWSHYWEDFPPPTDSTRKTIPNAYTAECIANRLLVPYGKDHVAVSDIGDYTQYQWTIDDFQINFGEADSLVRIFPWVGTTVIMFKTHSIFQCANVTGDLSQTTLQKLPGVLGLVGLKAVTQVAGDIYFMDWSGVYKISQVFEGSPQAAALPLSEAIRPVINQINWNAAAGIRANYRRERVYFAIPLKNAIRNNVLIIYNLTSATWESIDTFGDPDFRIDDLIRMDYNGERRLYAIDRLKGLVLLLEQGRTDLLGLSYQFEYQIDTSILTRGYIGSGIRNNFRRVSIDLASWNPEFSVDAYVGGANAKPIVSERTKSRTKYDVFLKPDWNQLNSNDDHASNRRKDYSVQLPIMLNKSGVELEREQETTERFNIGMMGRYCQLRIENSQGTVGIRSIIFEGFEDEREPRTHT
jgi:hypothetical protein